MLQIQKCDYIKCKVELPICDKKVSNIDINSQNGIIILYFLKKEINIS